MGCANPVPISDVNKVKPSYGDGEKVHLDVILRMLEKKVLRAPNIREMLLKSLKKAKELAEAHMQKDLYDYFDIVYPGCGWPETVDDYMKYVKEYVTQNPFATIRINWIHDRVSKSSEKYISPQYGFAHEYTKCVFNELCHFYWLVNQEVEVGANTTLQSEEIFASWIKAFGLASGIYLNTPESLTPETLETFEKDPSFNMEWYNDNRDKWKSFNDFFSRELNEANPITGMSPLRPVDPRKFVITAPADCTFRQVYRIDNKGVLRDTKQNPIIFKMKGFSKVSTVQDLLSFQACPYWEDFFGGTFIHYFLSPIDYHRFHTPVAGVVEVMETINGQNYLDVSLLHTGQFDAKDNSDSGWEFQQQRGLIIVDNEELGPVATLPIGMAQVSGVIMYRDQLLFKEVPKGQEFGRFVFGGSDIIMVIGKPVEQLTIVKGVQSTPRHFKYGEPAVTCMKTMDTVEVKDGMTI